MARTGAAVPRPAASYAGDLVFSRLIPGVLGTILLAGVALNFANVVSRYLLGKALFFTEEVLVFLMIWGVFLGLSAAAWKGEHLSMNLFSSRLPPRAARAVRLLAVVAMAGASVFVAVQSYRIVMLFAQAGQVSVAAGIPKAVPHAAILVGFVLLLIVVLLRWRQYLDDRFDAEATTPDIAPQSAPNGASASTSGSPPGTSPSNGATR